MAEGISNCALDDILGAVDEHMDFLLDEPCAHPPGDDRGCQWEQWAQVQMHLSDLWLQNAHVMAADLLGTGVIIDDETNNASRRPSDDHS